MYILIKADNSYEAVATKKTYASEIKRLQESIKESKKLLKNRKGSIAPMERIVALKLQLQHATPDKKEALRKKISDLRFSKGLGPRTTLSSLKREVTKWEKTIARDEAKIEKYKKLEAEKQERLRNAPKPKPVKQDPRFKIDDSSIMPHLTKDKAKGQHVVTPKKAREKTAAPVSTTHTKALTAADKKHAKAVDVVKSKIVELKAAMEKTRSEPKKAQLKLEINKQRAALRELNKGQRAANQAAVSGPKSSKSPMGAAPKAKTTGGKQTARQKEIVRMTAQVKEMREKVRELKAKNGGKVPAGGDRSYYTRYLNLRDELKALKAKEAAGKSPMGAAPKAKTASAPSGKKVSMFNVEVRHHLSEMYKAGMISKAKLNKAHKYIQENTSKVAGMNSSKASEVADTILHLAR